MMGRKNNQQTVKTDDPRGFANELNRFYARFDVIDFSRGENVRLRYIHIFLLRFISFYCYFKCTFLSLEPMCHRTIFIFMLCIMMNNKELFDLIRSVPEPFGGR